MANSTLTLTEETVSIFLDMLRKQEAMNDDVMARRAMSETLSTRLVVWSDAILTEAVECMGYLGWEWWKLTEENTYQAMLEAVDILHFVLADMITSHGVDKASVYLSAAYLDMEDLDCVVIDPMCVINQIVIEAVCGNPDVEIIVPLMELFHYFDMDLQDVHRWYVAKHTLNNFRQATGYSKGAYTKIWNGVEDNVYLARYMTENDTSPLDTAKLTEWLSFNYPG